MPFLTNRISSNRYHRLQLSLQGNFILPDIQPPATADIVSLDAARQRRHYFDQANARPVWLEIKRHGP